MDMNLMKTEFQVFEECEIVAKPTKNCASKYDGLLKAIQNLDANKKITKETPGFYPFIDVARRKWTYINPSDVVSIEMLPGFDGNSIDQRGTVIQLLRFNFSKGPAIENVNLTDIETETKNDLHQAFSKRTEQFFWGQAIFSILLIVLIIPPRKKL